MTKVDREETARKKVLKGLVNLRNEHKVVSLLIWVTKLGKVFFGTEGLKEQAKKAFNCKCRCTCGEGNASLWQDVLEQDEKFLNNSKANFDPGMDLLSFTKMDTPIEKLPMNLELMVYTDLAKWLRPQIIRDRQERGFTGVKIGFKDISWRPSFWPVDCDWMEVSNFSKWKTSEYTGPGTLTSVLKKAVENLLTDKNITPDEHVKINVDTEKMKRKEKWRGKHSNPEVFIWIWPLFVLILLEQ